MGQIFVAFSEYLNIMKKNWFWNPSFVRCGIYSSTQQTNKTCKKKAHEIYTKVRIYSLLILSDSFTNHEFFDTIIVCRGYLVVHEGGSLQRLRNCFVW